MDVEQLEALLPPLDDAPGPELSGGASADGLRYTGLELVGDATDARFLECVLQECDLGGVALDRVRFATSMLTDVRATAVSMPDATLLDVVVAGGRFGALTAHGAKLTRVWLQDLKVDFVNLRGATLVDVTLSGCTVGELDVSGGDLRDVRLLDTTVESLVLSAARHRSVDLRGAEIERLDGVADLRGCTISSTQLAGWAAGMAAHLGITVR